MRSTNTHKGEAVFKSILLAHFILILHVLLLAGVALLVFFFGGLVHYIAWIVLIGLLLLSGWGYLFYRRLRREGRSLRDALRSPVLPDRAVEVSFMGGMLSVRLGPPEPHPMIDVGPRQESPALESPETVQLRNMEILGRLLEKNLITPEEFAAAKRRYFGE